MNGRRPDIQRVSAANREVFINPPIDAQRHDRFTVLYHAHFHRILGYARRRTGADEAFDVAAETFTVAWRRLDELPPGDEALSWLYATARRVLANQRRSERRRLQLVGALRAAAAAGRSPEVADHRVAAALARLREDERELLLLFAWEGLDAAAVAEVMRCSRNAARIRLHRARRRFAQALASAGEDTKRSAGPGHVTSAAVGLEERS